MCMRFVQLAFVQRAIKRKVSILEENKLMAARFLNNDRVDCIKKHLSLIQLWNPAGGTMYMYISVVVIQLNNIFLFALRPPPPPSYQRKERQE